MFGMDWGRKSKAEIWITFSGYRTIWPRVNGSLDQLIKTDVFKSIGCWYVLKIK